MQCDVHASAVTTEDSPADNTIVRCFLLRAHVNMKIIPLTFVTENKGHMDILSRVLC